VKSTGLKKGALFLLMVALLFSGCGKKAENAQQDGKVAFKDDFLKIVDLDKEQTDLLKVAVKTGGYEIHSFELKTLKSKLCFEKIKYTRKPDGTFRSQGSGQSAFIYVVPNTTYRMIVLDKKNMFSFIVVGNNKNERIAILSSLSPDYATEKPASGIISMTYNDNIFKDEKGYCFGETKWYKVNKNGVSNTSDDTVTDKMSLKMYEVDEPAKK